jgi:hypothetical protein
MHGRAGTARGEVNGTARRQQKAGFNLPSFIFRLCRGVNSIYLFYVRNLHHFKASNGD